MQQLINIRKKCQVSALISTNENKGNLKHLGALAKKKFKMTLRDLIWLLQ